MPYDIGAVAQGATSEVVNGALGLVLGGINDRRQLNQQEKLQELQIKGQKEMTDYNTRAQLGMWNATGPQAQMKQLEAAGLNPALIYGGKGGGGQTASVTPGNVTGGQAPQGGGEAIRGMEMGLQLQMQQAQIKVLESQAEKNTVEAKKTAGIDTDIAGQQYDNLRQAFDNTKLEMTMKNIENYEKQASQGNRLDYIEYQAKTAMYQTGIIANEKQISDETVTAQTNRIKAESIGAVLKNELTKSQTNKTNSDIQVNQATINKMVQGIMQDWDKLDQENQKIRIQEQIKNFNTDENQRNTENIMNAVKTIMGLAPHRVITK